MKQTPRKKAMDALQKLARLKWADDHGYCQCVSCGKTYHWSEMDGGHFIPKGHSSYWALEGDNIHPQCKPCNGYGMKFGTAQHQYTLWMIDTYGREYVDEMEMRKRLPVKYYKKDYEEMTKDWNQRIRIQLDRIGE